MPQTLTNAMEESSFLWPSHDTWSLLIFHHVPLWPTSGSKQGPQTKHTPPLSVSLPAPKCQLPETNEQSFLLWQKKDSIEFSPTLLPALQLPSPHNTHPHFVQDRYFGFPRADKCREAVIYFSAFAAVIVSVSMTSLSSRCVSYHGLLWRRRPCGFPAQRGHLSVEFRNVKGVTQICSTRGKTGPSRISCVAKWRVFLMWGNEWLCRKVNCGIHYLRNSRPSKYICPQSASYQLFLKCLLIHFQQRKVLHWLFSRLETLQEEKRFPNINRPELFSSYFFKASSAYHKICFPFFLKLVCNILIQRRHEKEVGHRLPELEVNLALKHAKSLQLCLILCEPMDYSPPGSCVHGILQIRILEWVAMFSFRGSSQPRDWTQVSCVSYIGRGVVLYH